MKRKTLIESSLALAATPSLLGASEDDIDIIDTHTHFYDPRREQGIPWPNKKDPLHRPILPSEFMGVASPYGVKGTIVVEASRWLEDNQWLLDLAKKNPSIYGVVGHLDPGAEGFRENIQRFAKNKLFKGIRLGKSLYQLDDPKVMKDFELLEKLDLSVDILGGVKALQASKLLVEKLPNLRQIIEHLPFYNFRKKEDALIYQKSMVQLGKKKNVYAKISDVLTRVNGEVITDPEYYVNILDHQWENWGEDKVVYGSNWPVSDRLAEYKYVFQAVDHFLSTRSKEARRKFYNTNTNTVYNLNT